MVRRLVLSDPTHLHGPTDDLGAVLPLAVAQPVMALVRVTQEQVAGRLGIPGGRAPGNRRLKTVSWRRALEVPGHQRARSRLAATAPLSRLALGASRSRGG